METIDSNGLNTIENYLNINGQPAPYYLHKFKKYNFFPRRVHIGKGSPEEIHKAMRTSSAENLIGVDCSGFVCHIIDSIQPVKTVIKHPSKNLITQIRFQLRPIEKISVKVLIHPINAINIEDISQIRPGDLIHTWNLDDPRKRHILIVYRRDENDIYYAHASQTENKVVRGKFVITNPSGTLEDQKWPTTFFLTNNQKTSGVGLVRLRRFPSNSNEIQ